MNYLKANWIICFVTKLKAGLSSELSWEVLETRVFYRTTMTQCNIGSKYWRLKNHQSHCSSVICIAYIWLCSITLPTNSRTCSLYANTVHGLIAKSSPPCSIHIHIHTRAFPAWFIFSPAGDLQVPAINIPEITVSLKARMDRNYSYWQHALLFGMLLIFNNNNNKMCYCTKWTKHPWYCMRIDRLVCERSVLYVMDKSY